MPGDGVQIIAPREVELGGGGPGGEPLTVRRTLPSRTRTTVGPWCFLDHFGPVDVRGGPSLDVAPHPHSGLQTLTWLFQGEIEHRDSLGTHAMVRPGEVNLMTSGGGVAHTEVATPRTRILHGVQLWLALPSADREIGRRFQAHAAPKTDIAWRVSLRVFVGELAGLVSPIEVHSPAVGAEIALADAMSWEMPARRDFEYGLLVDSGEVTLCGAPVRPGEFAVVEDRRDHLTVAASGAARMVLLGGPPWDEELVVWWNFVGRTHEEIVAAREAWEGGSPRFGEVRGYAGRLPRVPAPALGAIRLRPRRNPVG